MRSPCALGLVLALSILACSCKDLGANSDFSYISDPVARWKAYNLSNYEMVQGRSCFCAYAGLYRVIVRNNAVAEVRDIDSGNLLPPDARQMFKTVDELFDILRSIDPNKVARFSVSYDKKYGYPSFYVDRDINIADEEFGYSIQELTQ